MKLIKILKKYFKINLEDGIIQDPLLDSWGTCVYQFLLLVIFALYHDIVLTDTVKKPFAAYLKTNKAEK